MTNQNDTGLNPDTTYYYWIKSYNSSGGSVFSEAASNTTFPLPPATPVIFSFQAVSTNQINLIWNDVANETSYTLFRNTVNDTNTIQRYGFLPDQTNYNDTNLSPNTYYYYWIKAYNGPSSSLYSTVVSNVPFPTPPQIVHIQAVSTNQIDIKWNKGINVASYTLFRSTNNNTGTASNIAGFPNANLTNYNDIGLAPDIIYYYWVKAYNDSGFSEFSSVASATTFSLPSEIKIPMEDVAVYNNHLDLSFGDPARIVFGKAGKVKIKIYTFRGVVVKDYPEMSYNIGDMVEWDGSYMDTGQKVASGVYIVIVTGDINKKMKMIVKN